MFFVILWGISGCELQGPFDSIETATSWLDDYEPDIMDQGSVIGPIPSLYTREFA